MTKHGAISMQASTSELYGKVQETPQKETTPFYPRSPYGEFLLLTISMQYASVCLLKYGLFGPSNSIGFLISLAAGWIPLQDWVKGLVTDRHAN